MQRTTSKRVEALEEAEGQRVEALVHRFAVQLTKAWAEVTFVEHILLLELEFRDPASDAEVAVVARWNEIAARFGLDPIYDKLERVLGHEDIRRRRDAVFLGAREKARRGMLLSADEEILASGASVADVLYDRCTPDELLRIETSPIGTMGQVMRELAQKYELWPADDAGHAN